jgi:hypothetical protein
MKRPASTRCSPNQRGNSCRPSSGSVTTVTHTAITDVGIAINEIPGAGNVHLSECLMGQAVKTCIKYSDNYATAGGGLVHILLFLNQRDLLYKL